MREWRERNREKLRDYNREYQKQWYRKNRDKRKRCPSLQPRYRRDYALAKRYQLTPEAYAALIASQANACALCRREFTRSGDTRPCVDHCHTTNKVRGVLCNECNVGLGKLGDTADSLRRALHYLENGFA